jgi:hypothetical protein
MESDESQHFNERLNQWVASQGLWYQLRYSVAGNGLSGTKGFHLLGVGWRLLVFLVLAAGLFAAVSLAMSGTEGYAKALEERIRLGLEAEGAEVNGYSRSGGSAMIAQLSSKGGEGTFFSLLEARNIRYPLGLLERVTGRSSPAMVTVEQVEIDLHSGADSKAGAEGIARALFEESGGGRPTRWEVKDATLRWGYSAGTRGWVENASLRANRTAEGWRLVFEGGYFHQNWLRKLEIVRLEVLCTPEGLVFKQANFRTPLADESGGQAGSVEFHDLRVMAGATPELDGRVVLRRYPLDRALPPAARPLAEGYISGQFKVSGSTYTAGGIQLAGNVVLGEGDLIRLTDRVHLLRALSVVDAYNSYKRVDFRAGSFRLATGGGRFELGEVNLDGGALMKLEGGLMARPATEAEKANAPAQGPVSPLFAAGADEPDLAEREGDLTLRQAGRAAAGKGGGSSAVSGSVLPLSQPEPMVEWQPQVVQEPLRFEGSFDISLPPDAFDRAPVLRGQYPGAGSSRRIPLKVPMQGSLHELTLDQAESIYRQGGR